MKLRSSLHLFLYTVRNTYCFLLNSDLGNKEQHKEVCSLFLTACAHLSKFFPPMHVCSIRSRARCFHRKALDDVPARIAKHLGRDLHVAAPDADACLPEYKQTSLASEREREVDEYEVRTCCRMARAVVLLQLPWL